MSYKILRSFALIEYENSSGDRAQVRSNITTTPLNTPPIRLICSASVQQVAAGDVFSYQFVIINEGIYPVSDLRLSDQLPSCMKYVSHSLHCNDTCFTASGGASSLSTGLYLGSLNAGCQKLVSFDVKLINMPKQDPIENTGVCTYAYPNFSSPYQLLNYAVCSNPCCLSLRQPELTLLLSCTSCCYHKEVPVTYHLQLYNTGTLTAYKPRLSFLMIPPEAAFLPNSLIINGQPSPLDPFSHELELAALSPGEYYHLEYTVIPSKYCHHILRHYVSALYHVASTTKACQMLTLKSEAAPYDLLPYSSP